MAMDFSNPAWHQRINNYGSTNPKIGLYILGAMNIVFDGIENPHKKNLLMRLLMAFFSSITVLLLFCLADSSGTIYSGWIALGLILINPVFRSVQGALLPEIPMLLFAMSALVCLQYASVNINLANKAWMGALGFGVFAGLSVGCKLYAFALFPLFLAIIVLRFSHYRWKAIPLFVIPCLVSFGIFALSNPILLQNFRFGIAEMTTNHLAIWAGEPFTWHKNSLAFIFSYPFDLFHLKRYLLSGDLPVPEIAKVLFFTYIVFLWGTIKAISKKNFIAVFWMLCSFAMVGYVVLTMHRPWIIPKVFLLPTTSVILMISQIEMNDFKLFKRKLGKFRQKLFTGNED